jgi:hypothetical protein
MKFWEELITYFPFIQHRTHRKVTPNNSSVVACAFVPAIMFLPSLCLAMTGDTWTDGRDL